MVKPRARSTAQQEQAAEEFAAKAEQPEEAETAAPRTTDVRDDLPAWKRRNKEPKTSGANIRVSKSQLQLLQRAAEAEETSQQKLIESILWPVLEERYGNR